MTSLLLGTPRHGHELREQIEVLAAEAADLTIVDHPSSASEVVASLEAAVDPVDVVVLHEGLETSVLDFAQDLNRRFPDVALLLLVAEEDPQQFREAMFAGFRGVISASMSLDDFTRVVRNAAGWATSVRGRVATTTTGTRRRRAGRIIAMAGSKGGVGCTLLSTSLALQAAEDPDRSVCLVDLDLQAGDVRSYLSTVHERSIHQLVPIASELNDQAVANVLFNHGSGLRVLLPPLEGELAEDVDAIVTRQVLSALRSRFDTVIVDVGAHMTDATAAAVELADVVCVVTTPDLPSLRGANRLTALWDRLQIRTTGIVAVANRVSRDSELQPDVLGRLLTPQLADHTVQAGFRRLEAPVNAGDLALADDAWRESVLGLARDLEAAMARTDEPTPAPGERLSEAGQATVEFVSILPLLALAILLSVQGAVWGWTHIQGQDAAREAARQLELSAGVDTDGDGVFDDVEATALGRLPATYRTTADVTQRGRTVEVELAVPDVLPLVRVDLRTQGVAGAAP